MLDNVLKDALCLKKCAPKLSMDYYINGRDYQNIIVIYTKDIFHIPVYHFLGFIHLKD